MIAFFKRLDLRIYIFISGIALGVSVAFSQVGFLAYFAMIPLALAIYKKIRDGAYKKKKSAYFDGFIFFIGYYLVCFHFLIYFYPLDFAGMSHLASAVVVGFAWIGLSLLQTVFAAFNVLWIYLFSKTSVYKKYPLLIAPFAASLWAVLEWTQTLTWAGVPWGRIALSQANYTVALQTSSFFGSYFVSFIIVLINFLFAYALFEKSKIRFCSAAALCVALANILIGTVAFYIPTNNAEKRITMAAVQGNQNSHEGVDFDRIFNVYSTYSESAARDGAEVIVWPETALPCRVLENDSICIYLSALSKRIGATLAVGFFTDNEDGKEVNSMGVFYPDGKYDLNAYSKQRPVPFGEFVPMRDIIEFLVPPLASINVLSSDLTPGERCELFSSASGGGVKIGTLICFDSIYEELAYGSVREGAEVIVVPTNDSWFYDSRGIYMHLYQAKIRAIETGRYIVRAGNTGISAVISDKGVIEETVDVFKEGYIVREVYTSNHRTLYSYIGNTFVYLLIAAALSPFVTELVIFIKKKKK